MADQDQDPLLSPEDQSSQEAVARVLELDKSVEAGEGIRTSEDVQKVIDSMFDKLKESAIDADAGGAKGSKLVVGFDERSGDSSVVLKHSEYRGVAVGVLSERSMLTRLKDGGWAYSRSGNLSNTVGGSRESLIYKDGKLISHFSSERRRGPKIVEDLDYDVPEDRATLEASLTSLSAELAKISSTVESSAATGAIPTLPEGLNSRVVQTRPKQRRDGPY
jgi:hypothetical protein